MVVTALGWAAPTQACVKCDDHFYWPWLDDCLSCDESNCGYVLCHLEEYAPGAEYCVLEGDDCNMGGRGCPDVQGSLPQIPGVKTLEQTWRLVKVKIKPARRAA